MGSIYLASGTFADWYSCHLCYSACRLIITVYIGCMRTMNWNIHYHLLSSCVQVIMKLVVFRSVLWYSLIRYGTWYCHWCVQYYQLSNCYRYCQHARECLMQLWNTCYWCWKLINQKCKLIKKIFFYVHWQAKQIMKPVKNLNTR